jgi:predicted nuclease of predicted toxin-antitoxin system
VALRLLLDQNLSPETSRFPREEMGFDVNDTRQLGLEAASDTEIAEYAAREGRIVVPFDSDFGDIREFQPGDNPGVIRLKIHPQTTELLHPILRDFFSKVSETDLRGALVTVEPGFYRIRRATSS